jgi:Transposase DDE domain
VASGKVARRAVGSEIAALLDSTEIAALIREIDASRTDARGCKGYGARALVGACLVKALYGLPTWTRVASLIADHAGLQAAGLQAALGGTPSVWACYRFTTKLRLHSDVLANCLDRVTAALQIEFPGIGQDVAIDGSDLPAFANGQRYVSKNGPERERFSDPDASWGHRSSISTRKGGGYYGYKLHALVCTRTGLPLAWEVDTAKAAELHHVASLIDTAKTRGFAVATCAMDKGYDNNTVHDACEQLNCHPIIPIRKRKPEHQHTVDKRGRPFVAQPIVQPLSGTPPSRNHPHVPRESDRFRTLYRNRGAVEREFGMLKNHFGLLPLRVRGLDRVQLHADLTMLARLSQALGRARAMPLAA